MAIDAVDDVVAIGHEDDVVPLAALDRLLEVGAALAERLVMALGFGIPDRLFAAIAHGAAVSCDPGFVVNGAGVFGFGIEVGLIAANSRDRRSRPATERRRHGLLSRHAY